MDFDLNGASLVRAVSDDSAHVVIFRIVRLRCWIGVDGSRPGAPGGLGGPRQCLRVDILPDVRQFAISNGNGEDPIVLKRPLRGNDSPLGKADDQNPVSLRYEFRRLWVRSFQRVGSL